MTLTSIHRFAAVLLALLATQAFADGGTKERPHWVSVSGTGVHYFTTAIVHSQAPTETGLVQRSTDIVELDGDLRGRILYHPVSRFDFAAGTLVNTGEQVFSGTVLGSEPVLIHDDSFRFDVNLFTGETLGRVYLDNPIAGPRIRCRLKVVGTGSTEAGDAMVSYTGTCRMPPERRRDDRPK